MSVLVLSNRRGGVGTTRRWAGAEMQFVVARRGAVACGICKMEYLHPVWLWLLTPCVAGRGFGCGWSVEDE